MKEVIHRVKQYVSVSLTVDQWGNKRPEMIIMDGTKYPISDSHFRVYGSIKRYQVTIYGKESYLYEEASRWYVRKKIYSKPSGATTYGDRYKHPHSPDY